MSDWSYWAQDDFEAFMEAVIHFPNGNITITDDMLSDISINARMFDTSHELFGPPEPATCILDIVDYEQRFNPVLNSQLTSGLQVDIYLGMWPTEHTGFVATWGNLHSKTWSQLFVYKWNTLNDISNTPLFKEHYGVFYTQEWTYDAHSHVATVDMIDKIAELLSTDNRLDGPKPATSVSLRTFISTLISLFGMYTSRLFFSWEEASKYTWSQLHGYTWAQALSTTSALGTAANTVILPYSFYEDTMAATLNNGIEALASSLLCDQTGTMQWFKRDWIGLNVTLTDADIEEYELTQSSAAVYDSVDVHAQLPTKKTNTSLVSLESQVLQYGNFDRVAFTTSRVYSADTVNLSLSGNTVPYVIYDFTILDVYWRHSTAFTYDTWEVLGSVIDLAEQNNNSVVALALDRPYSITSNGYIPTVARATELTEYLAEYILDPYFTIKVTLRGYTGFWPGSALHIKSDLYHIDADYTIVELDFNYNGGVHTTLTLQKV